MNKLQFLKVWLFIFLLFTILNLNQMFWRFIVTHKILSLQNKNSTVSLTKAKSIINTNSYRRQKQYNKDLLLAVGVLNRLSLKGRRDVIRMTWFKECKRNPDLVRCYFFTDSYDDLNQTEVDKILEENRIYNDMQFMTIKAGHRFTERLLWMLQWYTENYPSFQYFLRVDDDYFICMERLLYELPFRPDNGLYWGYTHCTDNVIRVDEGWMILSRDIIKEALSKLNSTLLCHPFGDQAVALWIKDSKLDIKWFPDNDRIVHHATAYKEKQYMFSELCHRYLAMHGSYQLQMLKYWIVTREHLKNTKRNKMHFMPAIPQFSSFCTKNRTFDLNAFYPHVRFPAKLCKDKPEWGVSKQKFVGREEHGKEMIF